MGNTIESMCDVVNTSTKPEHTVPARPMAAGPVTRGVLDACFECDRACAGHPFKAYLVCSAEGCTRRRSITHVPQFATDANKKLPHSHFKNGNWMCQPCMQAAGYS